MKQQVAVGIVAAALVVGAGTGLVVREVRSDDAAVTSATSSTPSVSASPTPNDQDSPTPTPTEEATSEPDASEEPVADTDPLPLGKMQINTGAVGPVRVGMSQRQALATGYFDADVPSEGCEGTDPLRWTSNYYNALDVLTDRAGAIASIGISGRGPKTRSGLEINSTLAEVRDVIGPEHEPRAAGYGQTGLFVNDGDAWIGFLFDARPDDVSQDSVVSFIEVTRGARPGLVRDGC
jgi:hypothetical protein